MKFLAAAVFLSLTVAAQATIQASGDKVMAFELKNYSLDRFLAESANVLERRVTVDASIKDSIAKESLNLDVNSKLDKKRFSEILNSVMRSFGFTLIENNSGLVLINSRDLRYMPSPVVLAKDIKEGGEVYTMAVFKTKYPVANEISRNLRPFLSRYARVISLSDARHIIVSDTQKNIMGLKELIATMDTESTYKTSLQNIRAKALEKAKEKEAAPVAPKPAGSAKTNKGGVK